MRGKKWFQNDVEGAVQSISTRLRSGIMRGASATEGCRPRTKEKEKKKMKKNMRKRKKKKKKKRKVADGRQEQGRHTGTVQIHSTHPAKTAHRHSTQAQHSTYAQHTHHTRHTDAAHRHSTQTPHTAPHRVSSHRHHPQAPTTGTVHSRSSFSTHRHGNTAQPTRHSTCRPRMKL